MYVLRRLSNRTKKGFENRNEKFKLALSRIYNRYCKVFEYFGGATAIKRCIEKIESECEKANKMANDKISNYIKIMTDQQVKDNFFAQLNLLIKNETNYKIGRAHV